MNDAMNNRGLADRQGASESVKADALNQAQSRLIKVNQASMQGNFTSIGIFSFGFHVPSSKMRSDVFNKANALLA